MTEWLLWKPKDMGLLPKFRGKGREVALDCPLTSMLTISALVHNRRRKKRGGRKEGGGGRGSRLRSWRNLNKAPAMLTPYLLVLLRYLLGGGGGGEGLLGVA